MNKKVITFIYHDTDADGMLGKTIFEHEIIGDFVSIPYIHNQNNHLEKTKKIITQTDMHDVIFKNKNGLEMISIILVDCYFNIDELTTLFDGSNIPFICVNIFDHHKSNINDFLIKYILDKKETLPHYNCYTTHIKRANNMPVIINYNYDNGICGAMLAKLATMPDYYSKNIKTIVDYVNDTDLWKLELLPDSLDLFVGLKSTYKNKLLINTDEDAVLEEVYGAFFKQMLELESQGYTSNDATWQELFQTYSNIGKEFSDKSKLYAIAHADSWKEYDTVFGKGVLITTHGLELNVISSTFFEIKNYDGFVFTVTNIDYDKDEMVITFRAPDACDIQLGIACSSFSNNRGGGHDKAAGMTVSYSKFREFLGLNNE